MHCCIREVGLSMHVVISHRCEIRKHLTGEVSPLSLYTGPFSLPVKDWFFQLYSEFLVFVRIYCLAAH